MCVSYRVPLAALHTLQKYTQQDTFPVTTDNPANIEDDTSDVDEPARDANLDSESVADKVFYVLGVYLSTLTFAAEAFSSKAETALLTGD